MKEPTRKDTEQALGGNRGLKVGETREVSICQTGRVEALKYLTKKRTVNIQRKGGLVK